MSFPKKDIELSEIPTIGDQPHALSIQYSPRGLSQAEPIATVPIVTVVPSVALPEPKKTWLDKVRLWVERWRLKALGIMRRFWRK